MKALLLVAVLGISSLGFAQNNWDTLYAVVNGNQVSLHQDNVEANCAFTPIPDNVVVSGSIIDWYLVDTIGAIAVCECFFNYSVAIDSLSPGDYTVNVYSAITSPFMPDTLYGGSTNFTITAPYQCDNLFQLSSYAGPCHEYDGIRKHNGNIDLFSIGRYPGGLSVTSNGTSKIDRVELSNLSGKELLKVDYNAASEIHVATCSIVKGFYIISVYDNTGTRMNRKVAIF